jgi:AcrR family transcriptional regulator
VGARERNKSEKRERIRNAALKLFSEQGYEATTMRQVAQEARVALGTLSLYAADKRDLSLLAFIERIGGLADEAEKTAWRANDATLEERLLAFFRVFYRDFCDNITLARIFLQLNYQPTGMHGPDYKAMSDRMAAALARMVAEARSRGEVRSGEPDDLIARHVFFMFSGAVRWWIAEPDPKLREGLDELARLLRLQMRGLAQPG